MSERAYYTLTEAAERLQIGRTTVYEEVTKGRIKAKRFGERSIRIPAEELLRYEREADYEYGAPR